MSYYPPPAPRQRSVAGTVLKVIGVLLVLCVLALIAVVVFSVALLQLA